MQGVTKVRRFQKTLPSRDVVEVKFGSKNEYTLQVSRHNAYIYTEGKEYKETVEWGRPGTPIPFEAIKALEKQKELVREIRETKVWDMMTQTAPEVAFSALENGSLGNLEETAQTTLDNYLIQFRKAMPRANKKQTHSLLRRYEFDDAKGELCFWIPGWSLENRMDWSGSPLVFFACLPEIKKHVSKWATVIADLYEDNE